MQGGIGCLLLSFIKYHLKSNILICFVYGLLFFFQLVLAGEAICENGFDHSRIEDTTYTYSLTEFEYGKIDDLLKNRTLNYSDICIVAKNGVYDFVSYPRGVDERRLGYRKVSTPDEDGIIDLSEGISTESLFRAEIVDGQMLHAIPHDDDLDSDIYEVKNKFYIGDKEYKKGQYISIKNTYEEEMSMSQLYCSYQTFKEIDPKGKALISFAFRKPLKEDELTKLSNVMSNIGNSNLRVNKHLNDADRRNLVGDFSFVAIMIIIAMFCFSALMISVLSERNAEYHVLLLCGAKKGKIRLEKAKHVIIILVLSILIGLVVFWIIRSISTGFIDYKNDNALFYTGNLGCFVISALITMCVSAVFDKNRRIYAH